MPPRRSPQRRLEPPSESRLTVPLSEAQTVLNERILLGREMESREIKTQEEIERLQTDLDAWRDYNRTWLSIHLGGVASKEYVDASTHYFMGGLSPSQELKWALRNAHDETDKLESIRNRLSLWEDKDLAPTPAAGRAVDSGDVFVVHGSDEGKANIVARCIEQNTDRKAVILHEQPNGGRTILEKFEAHAADASYAVVVLTADDEGAKKGQPANPRARQNVVFEMGFFFGAIGRDRVCVLYESGVEQPSDIQGLVYVEWDTAGAWKSRLLEEMKHVGIG